MQNNILISCAGRQVYLVKAFKESLQKMTRGFVYTCDLDTDAPAGKVSDGHLVAPKFQDKDYIPWLVKLCENHNIKLLLTLNVDDLLVLERNRSLIEQTGCFLVGGDLDTIKETTSKLSVNKISKDIGLEPVKTFSLKNSAKIEYPAILKPVYGKGSQETYFIKNEPELKTRLENSIIKQEDFILQQFIQGQEYGLDIVNDFQANYVGVLARKKFAMKNGETFAAQTVAHVEWVPLAKKLSARIKHHGTIDIDIIENKNGELYLIDINHRFGGGYIFNSEAGANIPEIYISNIIGIYVSDCLSYSFNLSFKRNGFSLLPI